MRPPASRIILGLFPRGYRANPLEGNRGREKAFHIVSLAAPLLAGWPSRTPSPLSYGPIGYRPQATRTPALREALWNYLAIGKGGSTALPMHAHGGVEGVGVRAGIRSANDG